MGSGADDKAGRYFLFRYITCLSGIAQVLRMAMYKLEPSLRTKKVQELKGVFECSVNMAFNYDAVILKYSLIQGL
jgi:hypothetical protein